MATVMLAMVPIALALALSRLSMVLGEFAGALVAAAFGRTCVLLYQRKGKPTPAGPEEVADLFLRSLGVMLVAFVALTPVIAALALFAFTLLEMSGRPVHVLAIFILMFSVPAVCVAYLLWLWYLYIRKWQAWVERLGPYLRSQRTRVALHEVPQADFEPEFAAPVDVADSASLDRAADTPAPEDALEGFARRFVGDDLARAADLGQSAGARNRHDLRTLIFGMLPIALIFAAARVPLALGAALIALYLGTVIGPQHWLEPKREDEGATATAPASALSRILRRLRRVPRAVLALAETFPAGFAAGALVLTLVTLHARNAGAAREVVISTALLASALWLMLVLAMVPGAGRAYGGSQRGASQIGMPPQPHLDENEPAATANELEG